jgi:hypothetical protein
MKKFFFALFAAAIPSAALATPPDACSILTLDEVNSVAGGLAVTVQPVHSGNPTECIFADAKRAAVLTIRMREVQYAAADELHQERETDQKVYRTQSKDVAGVGEHAYWMPHNGRLGFHKGKTLVFVTFQQPKYQNEVATAQIARMIESHLK